MSDKRVSIIEACSHARNAETKSLIAYIEKITIYFTLLTQSRYTVILSLRGSYADDCE